MKTKELCAFGLRKSWRSWRELEASEGMMQASGLSDISESPAQASSKRQKFKNLKISNFTKLPVLLHHYTLASSSVSSSYRFRALSFIPTSRLYRFHAFFFTSASHLRLLFSYSVYCYRSYDTTASARPHYLSLCHSTMSLHHCTASSYIIINMHRISQEFDPEEGCTVWTWVWNNWNLQVCCLNLNKLECSHVVR